MTLPLPHQVTQIATDIAAGKVTAREVTERALARARATEQVGAFLGFCDDALECAERVDQKRVKGEPLGVLGGVPMAVKDALCTQGTPTTAASRMLTRDGKTHAAGWVPGYDATVVQRLKAAGAVIVGKANMDEFAMGSSNENSAFGAVKNPWCLERIPGGSSGGSAAAVASRAVSASLGSDTGGSIRQPAALCGVVGVKPSYGRVSRYGLVAFASSLDQVGPLAGDVRGAARVLGVIAGHCPKDSTSADVPVPKYEEACDQSASGLRVGVPAEYFEPGLDDEVRQAVESAIDGLRSLGCEIKKVSLPHTRYGVSTYYVLATAEASSNLSRFDGVRYGLRKQEAGDSLAEMYANTRAAGFGPEVKRRIMLGTYALSTGYYDAYYRKAQQVRTLIAQDFSRAFAEVDVMLTPSSPTAAFRLGEKSDPLQMYLADIYTLPASLAGICGLSMPAGLSASTSTTPSLPLGVQLLAPAFEEATLFRTAAAWESLCPVSGRFPEL